MAIDLEKVDLGSFGISDPETIPDEHLESTMSEAFKIQPDSFAKLNKLSQESGVPTFAVESNPVDVETNLKLDQIDFSGMSRRSPHTTKFLTDFNNAVIAQDDFDVLELLESVFDFGKAFENIGETISTGFSSQLAGLKAVGVDSTPSRIQDLVPSSSMPIGMEFEAAMISQDLAEHFNINTDEELQQAKSDAETRIISELRELHEKRAELTPQDLNLLEQGVRAGVESLATMAPGFALMLLSGGRAAPLLTTIGIQTYGEAYGTARAEGLTPEESTWFASIDAAIEVGTELLPTGTLETILTGQTKGLKKDALKFLVREMGTEQIATMGQSINAFAFGLDEQLEQAEDINEMLHIQLQRQAVTAIATVVAGGAQAAAVTTIRKAIEKVAQEDQALDVKSDVEQRKIDQIDEGSSQSKLKQRDAESFRQFIEEADGENNTHVFIDAVQTSLYLQSKTRKEIAEDAGLTLLDEQVREASLLGGDVVIPVADFTTDIANTDSFGALRDSMTLSEDTIAPFRQEQVKQETENYVKGLLNEAEENISEFVEAQEIFNSVRDQLIDTGTVTPQNASVMAQIVPAWATVHAQKNGITVQQSYEDSGLAIEGPETGRRAELAAEAELLEQAKKEPIILKGEGDVDLVETSEPVTFNFIHNTESATSLFGVPDKEAPFGRGFEPAGRFIIVTSKKNADEATGDLIGGEITLRNPLVVPANGTKWKKELSEKHGGKTGKKLSKAIIADGFDGIITTEKDQISEVVEFTTFDEAKALFQEPVEVLEQPLIKDQEKADTILSEINEFSDVTDDGLVTVYHRTNKKKADEIRKTGQMIPNENGLFFSTKRDGQAEGFGDEVVEFRIPLDRLQLDDVFDDEAHLRIPAKIGKATDVSNLLITPPERLEQPPAPKKPAEARGYYDPANAIIRLTEASDLSSFLHEFAHFMYEMELNTESGTVQSINNWYKRNATDVAKEASTYLDGDFDVLRQGERDGDAPIKITENDIINFLDNEGTGNKDKDNAIRRAVHEQFARGFETYLMEGKAPSTELRNAFRTFARWLAQIYRGLVNARNVKLDAEMRQVFDRLLATEEQIAAAEARARYEPMFTDAAMASMTEAEFTAYEALQEKIKDVQTEELRDKLIKQLTRQTQAWWNEEKADIIDEELESLRTQQVYVTREALRAAPSKKEFTDEIASIESQLVKLRKRLGRDIEAEEVSILSSKVAELEKRKTGIEGDITRVVIKLDRLTVKEMGGEIEIERRGKKTKTVSPKLKGMTLTGGEGIHPDEAAAFFGYPSGSEMIDDLIAAPPIQEAAEIAAEARMVDIHGDIMTDGTIEMQADEAVQNEERGRLILSELKALAKGTSQPTINRAVIKGIAEEQIGKLSFRQIHPGKYRKAEIKAAQEAAVELAAGNRETASGAKARQAMNYYLGMEATQAKAETMKIVDRMSRYNKKRVREEIQKAGNEYWEQIVKILKRFEFRKTATLKSVNQINTDINTWMRNQNENEGDGLVLSNAVLNESFITHWKNVPFTDLEGINDSVKNIEHVARYSNRITRQQETIDFNKLVDKWVTAMEQATPDTRFISKRTDIIEGKNWGRWFMAQMTKIPIMASWLDGGERVGISHDVLVQPFTDAYQEELKLWDDVGSVVANAINNRDKATRKRHNTKIFIPAIDDHLYIHQIIAVALNTGNQGNLRKLLLGEGWADPKTDSNVNLDNPQLQAVLSHLEKSDWKMVQLIWDQMNLLFPQLAEVHRRTTGLTPPKVEATPVETPFGTFEGGYYPIKYDPNRSLQAELNEDKLNAETESMFSNSASIQASVNTGATNERTGFYAPIRLSLDVIPAHFQETIHYITHHDPVRETNKLIKNQRVAKTIKEKIGPEEYAQLSPWLNDIAKDGREAPTKMFWDDMLGRLRFGVTLGVMGFKASTGIIQISGLSNTIAEVGLGPVMLAMRNILGSPTTIRSAWDFAVENSKVLDHRAQTMDREIKNAMKRLADRRGPLAAAQEASMKHIALIQTYMVDLPSWHAAYIEGMRRWEDEQRAFNYADFVIENVQGSGVTKDLARIMRGQSETSRMFTMFMTFFSSLWNMQRDLVKGAKTGRYSPTNVAAKAMFLFAIPVLFEMLMRGELGGDDEEDDAALQKYLTSVAMYPLQSIPFIRDVVNASTGEYGYNISPLASVIEQGTRTIPKIVTSGFTDDEITEGQVKGASKFVGAVLGIPGVNQMWATGEHLHDVIEEGEELTLHQLLFGPERD